MRTLVALLCLLTTVALVAASTCVNTVQAITVKQEGTVVVNLGINYGNGTIQWHNATLVSSGEYLLNATMQVAVVDFMNFPGFTGPGLPGAFVTGINGVNQNPAANLYWTYWVYNAQTQLYEMMLVGAGSYAITSDQTIQWYYQNSGSLTNPALRPYTSVSLSVRLDTSSDPPTAVISGTVSPNPGGPVNVTLEFSTNQGLTYQEISQITSATDGTFGYSWRLPGGGMFMIRADAQGVKSAPVSIGTSGGIPGFPLESILAGSALGLLLGTLRRKRHRDPSTTSN